MPIVAQGGTVTLTARVGHANGNPADSAGLTLMIYDTPGVPVAGFPVAIPPIVRDDLGAYHYVWEVPALLPIGDYTATWDATVDLADAGGSEQVEVVTAGAITTEWLAVADYKALVTTSATDAAIEAALAAAQEAILDAGGPIGDVTEHIAGGHNHVMLGNRAAGIVRVVERAGLAYIELDPTDYALSATGGFLTRLNNSGPNASPHFRGQVEVVYERYIGEDTRKAVQAELAALDLGDSTGASTGARTQERIGEWSENWAATGVPQTIDQRRESILARLNPETLTFWTSGGRSATPAP